MAATGNEVARLEQLKGVFPQVITLQNSVATKVALGNGRQVSLRRASPSTSGVTSILARVMYNSVELLQVASDIISAVSIQVSCDYRMNLFYSKVSGRDSRLYILNYDKSINMVTVKAETYNFQFEIDERTATLLGATIYVD